MIKICAIVEGYGDFAAVPSLIAKMAAHIGIQAVAPNPIRAGEWQKLKREGSLESYLELAQSRAPDVIVVLLDLDDGCPVDEASLATARIEQWKGGRVIRAHCCFLSREYETIFLHAPSCLGDFDSRRLPNDPENIRGAKEAIKSITGTRYKETQHQLEYTQRLDIAYALEHSRPLRKLRKIISQ